MNDQNQEVDIHLLERIRRGEPDSREELVKKYVPMVKHIVRNHYASFLEFDDLMQEGLIGLLGAITEYRPDQFDVKFSSFAYICILRKIYNVIKHSNGNKHKLLNEAISLHSFVNAEESRTIFDRVEDEDLCVDPEEIVTAKLSNQRIRKVLEDHLSLLEFAVIVLLLQGYSVGEVVQEIGVSAKAVDNARTRVKLKLRRLVKRYGSLLHPGVSTVPRRRPDLYLKMEMGS